MAIPQPDRMLDCIARLRTADGGYTNHVDMPLGLTPSSAAAVCLLRQLAAARSEPWECALGLLRPRRRVSSPAPWRLSPTCSPRQPPCTPWPCLISICEAIVEPASTFRQLWTNRGGFYGSWEDDTLDCEYTYYGLLTLGHLVR